MESYFYAVFDRKGFVRTYKDRRHGCPAQPSLAPGERAVRLRVRIPDAVFQPIGVPTATVDVPEAAVRFPMPEPVVAVMPADEARPA